jgi:hypothetical protein
VTFAALAAMAVVLSVAMLISSFTIPVEAKITCQTRSGNTLGAQQDRDKCRGEGLDFNNPQGKMRGGCED